MGFGKVRGSRATSKTRAIGIAAMTLLLSVAGVAWGASITDKGKSFELARTYEVALPAGGGEQHLYWEIGDVTIEATLGSAFDSNTGGYSFGVASGVTNNGANDIAVIGRHPDDPYGGRTTWLGSGERMDGEGLGVGIPPGEAFNTGDPPGSGRSGGSYTVAILDYDNVSATGLFAWSFRYDPSTQTGNYVLTLQMRG